MPKINIDQDKCKGCALCIFFCPKKEIKLGEKLNKKGVNPAVFQDAGKCAGCGFCAVICPDSCIEVYK